MKKCPVCTGSYSGHPTRCPIDGATLEPDADSNLGRLVDGWRLEAVLAEGALATVYRAARGEVTAVLKLYRRNVPLILERARREGVAHARVRHPRVAQLLDQGTLVSGEVYLVSELVCGQTLRATLDGHALAWPEAVRIAAQIAEGLSAIHQRKLVHRDLKPENVMLEASSQGEPSAKILDLGHALLLDADRLTESGLVWGSAAYMSPEQAAAAPVDERSDLYALGVVLYEMLVGHRPFVAKAGVDVMQMHQRAIPVPPIELLKIPASVNDMCLWLLSKRPGQRPASARVAHAALHGILATAHEQTALPPGPAPAQL